MSGPLEGVRVVDIDCDLAGAYACMLLADLGAEVIKVEPPESESREAAPVFRLWNRGRKSVAFDLRSPESGEFLRRLLGSTDVLVETLTPGEARRLAIDYDSLASISERLVYCAMPPFGEAGPLADLPADEGVVSAYSGVYGDQGSVGQPPIYVHLPVASFGAAFLAAFAITSALYTRESTGRGQKIEVPLYNGSVAMQSGTIVSGPSVRSWLREAIGQQGANPVYRLYRCRDSWMMVAAGNGTFWNKLCIALEMEELVEDTRFEGAPWNIPVEHRHYLVSLLSEKFRQQSRDYWIERLAAYDVPVAPAESRESFARHPQVLHNGILVDIDDPVLGPTRQIGLPVVLHQTPGRVSEPAPGLGQHTDEVLSGLGYRADEVRRLADRAVVGTG